MLRTPSLYATPVAGYLGSPMPLRSPASKDTFASPACVLGTSAYVDDSCLYRDSKEEEDGNPFEPSSEPCADDISWDELLFWLGDADSGRVDCPCGACRQSDTVRTRDESDTGNTGECQECRCLKIPTAFYARLSPLIPVIALPRIDTLPPHQFHDEW